jgi:hypothetical protein
LSLLSLAFIFGTPLYAILYYGLPFASQLHTPFRWVFPLSLAVAVLAGFGADYLAQTREGSHRAREDEPAVRGWASDRRAPGIVRPFFWWGRPSLITALAGLALWGGLLLLLGLFASRLWYSELAPLIERLFLGLARATDAFPSARAFYSYQFRQLFLLGLMLVATGTVLRLSRCPIFVGWRTRKRPIWVLMAAVVIVLDLFLAHYGFNAAVDPALVRYRPEMVQWLQAQPGQWRLTTFAPRGDKPFNANAAWLFDLQDVRGYDSIIPRQYTSYMAAIEPQNELQFNRIQPITNWESLNSPLLDVLGVKYVITAESIDLPKLQLAWQGEGLRVYENLAAAPRAYTLPRDSTAIVDDPLSAMTEFDPRHYVVVDRDDLAPQTETALPVPPLPEANAYTAANVESYRNIEVVGKP